MPVSQAQKNATTRFENKTYDKVLLRMRKDGDITRDDIQNAADAAGESLNAYVLNAVKARMNGGS